jgi:hypothetical protein
VAWRCLQHDPYFVAAALLMALDLELLLLLLPPLDLDPSKSGCCCGVLMIHRLLLLSWRP